MSLSSNFGFPAMSWLIDTGTPLTVPHARCRHIPAPPEATARRDGRSSGSTPSRCGAASRLLLHRFWRVGCTSRRSCCFADGRTGSAPPTSRRKRAAADEVVPYEASGWHAAPGAAEAVVAADDVRRAASASRHASVSTPRSSRRSSLLSSDATVEADRPDPLSDASRERRRTSWT